MHFICADKPASSQYVSFIEILIMLLLLQFFKYYFFFYLKLAVMVQPHEEEEQVSMSLPILHRSVDPTELEDIVNLNFVPKKKDIMKVPLIPDTDTFDSQ